MPHPPRLLVLGAGPHQTPLIRRAEGLGIEVVVADYLPDSPGKGFATHVTSVSAVDVEGCIDVGRRFAVDGVVTTGTDMPVVTMAAVAEALGLPCYLTPRSARLATDKDAMHEAIVAAGGAMPASSTVRPGETLSVSDTMRFPIVVKPVDSQGQRGVTIVQTTGDLPAAVEEARAHSRSGTAIAEEYIEGTEITVNAWMHDGELEVLALTDRDTYNPPPGLGIAYRHVYPSILPERLTSMTVAQARLVADAFGVRSGPLYIQMIAGHDHVVVIEGAARVGGGHESELIPLVSGVDVIGRLLALAMPSVVEQPSEGPVEYDAAVVRFLYAITGVVGAASGYVGDSAIAKLYVEPGADVSFPRNGTHRVGYILSWGTSRADALEAADDAVAHVTLSDGSGRSLLHAPDAEYLSIAG